MAQDAFKDCTGLTGAITIPSSVTEIGVAAFFQCSSITSVILSAATSLTSLSTAAFEGYGSTLAMRAEGANVDDVPEKEWMDCKD